MVQSYLDIFASVILETRRVVFPPIDLHADLTLDNEIDSLDVTQRNLRFDAIPGKPKASAGQTFWQRLTRTVDPVLDTSALDWQSQHEGLEIHQVELAGVERPIDRGDCRLERFVQYHSLQRVKEIHRHRGSSRCLFARTPMQYNTGGFLHFQFLMPIVCSPEPRRIVVDCHVKGMLPENPSALRRYR